MVDQAWKVGQIFFVREEYSIPNLSFLTSILLAMLASGYAAASNLIAG